MNNYCYVKSSAGLLCSTRIREYLGLQNGSATGLWVVFGLALVDEQRHSSKGPHQASEGVVCQ